jgi:hypothetical protein
MPRSRDIIVPNAVKGIEEVVITHTKTKRGTIRTKEKIVPVVLPKRSGQSSKSRQGPPLEPPSEKAQGPDRAIHTIDGAEGNPYLDDQDFVFPDLAPVDSQPPPPVCAGVNAY